MTITKYFRAFLLPIIFIAGCTNCLAQAGNYDEMIKEARALMKEDKLPEAKARADEAAKLDPKRYEAFAVAALIAVKQGDTVAGKDAVAKALLLAPSEKRASLEALQKKLAETGSESPSEAAKAPALPGQSSSEQRLKLEVLKQIVADADNAKTPQERYQRLQEYLKRSEELLKTSPNLTSVWVFRAAIALEINNAHVGWEAGHSLLRLKADSSGDPKVVELLAKLDRAGWLGGRDPNDIQREQVEAQRLKWEAEQASRREAIRIERDEAIASHIQGITGSWRIVFVGPMEKERFKGFISITNTSPGLVTVKAHFDYAKLQGYWTKFSVDISGAVRPQLVTLGKDSRDGQWKRGKTLQVDDSRQVIEFELPAVVKATFPKGDDIPKPLTRVHFGPPFRDYCYLEDNSTPRATDFCLMFLDSDGKEPCWPFRLERITAKR
jgi:tetratricopeptide (TPR) repeat protein